MAARMVGEHAIAVVSKIADDASPKEPTPDSERIVLACSSNYPVSGIPSRGMLTGRAARN